jgi:hypothetical protein
MKVGKAKGLNTIWLLHVARDPRRLLRGQRILPHRSGVEIPEPCQIELLPGAFASLHQPNPLTGRIGRIVFRPSSLVTFFWASRRK